MSVLTKIAFTNVTFNFSSRFHGHSIFNSMSYHYDEDLLINVAYFNQATETYLVPQVVSIYFIYYFVQLHTITRQCHRNSKWVFLGHLPKALIRKLILIKNMKMSAFSNIDGTFVIALFRPKQISTYVSNVYDLSWLGRLSGIYFVCWKYD